jgi:hypothetical protein
MEKDNKIKWLIILKMITDNVTNTKSIIYEGQEFLFKYIGRETDRMGYLIIWEKNSKRAVSISRLKVPICHKMIRMDDEIEFLKQIPRDLIFEDM